MPEIWTNSRLKCLQTCPMKEKFRYRDELVPIGRSKALQIGTAIHKGIELWSVVAGVKELETQLPYPSSTEEANEQTIALATVQAMLEGYFAIYDEFKEHQPETLFDLGMRYPIKGGKMRTSRAIHVCGKIDDIATINGEQWLVEYKTASQIDKSYFDRLYVDSQITMYMMAARRMGYKPVGVIYRVLKKPSIRQRQNETVEKFTERLRLDYLQRPEFYYYETRLYRTQDDLIDFEKELWYQVVQAERNARKGVCWRHTKSCSDYGTCPYLPLCMRDNDAELMFEHREANEELRG